MYFGRYPEDGLALFGDDVPPIGDGDMKTICQPLDFFAVNIYSGRRTRAGKDGQPEAVPMSLGQAMTAFHWAVSPEVLY